MESPYLLSQASQPEDLTEVYRLRDGESTKPYSTSGIEEAWCASVFGWKLRRVSTEFAADGRQYGVFHFDAPERVSTHEFEQNVRDHKLHVQVELAQAARLRTDLHRQLKRAKNGR